ncbi:MAG TPA: CsgG/HfaB family protein [Dyella sp.]|uniref:CsgG/HfaB family protein n=1 Tax=Dyella sp. TaxID=1869338 RepID=UPI002D767329|nr:CsgG/HfaB family protein [Dyella sp.]HET6553644.1 CsgG/HfaB family protein [Dyella sp.]
MISDGIDRLGSQAKTVLILHLQHTHHFNVLERDNLEEIGREAAIKSQVQRLKGSTASSLAT